MHSEKRQSQSGGKYENVPRKRSKSDGNPSTSSKCSSAKEIEVINIDSEPDEEVMNFSFSSQDKEREKRITNVHEAAESGDPILVREALQRGDTVNARDYAGNTPLHVVVTKAKNDNKHRCVKLLVRNEADARLKNNKGESVFDLALKAGIENTNWETVELLLENEDIHVARMKVLVAAVKMGTLKDLEKALREISFRDDDIWPTTLELEDEGTLLHAACRRGNYDIMKYLLEESFGEEMEPGNAIPLYNPLMSDILHACAENTLHLEKLPGKLEERKTILEYLIYRNKKLLRGKDKHGNPLLMANKIHLELIKYLLENGADLLATSYDRTTLLHKVCAYQTPTQFHELVTYLIEKKHNVCAAFNASCKDGSVPLHRAVEFITKETLQLMLSLHLGTSYAGVNAPHRSILYSAIDFGRNAEFIDVLVISGAGGDGWKADAGLRIAIVLGNTQAMRYFISKCEFNSHQKRRSLLELFFRNQLHGSNVDIAAVRCLVEDGACINTMAYDDDDILVLNESSLLLDIMKDRKSDKNIVELIKYFLSRGTEFFQSSIEKNVLVHAARIFNPKQFHDLAEHFAEIGREDFFFQKVDSNCPIFEAMAYMDPLISTLKLFKFYGANFSSQRAIFQHGMRHGRSASFLRTLVVDFKVVINCRDEDGYNSYHEAARQGSLEYLQLIDSLGGSGINETTVLGCDTPLHLALKNASTSKSCVHDVVVELLRLGGDPTIENQQGVSPLNIADRFFYDNRVDKRTVELLRREKVDGDSIFRALGLTSFSDDADLEELKLAVEACQRRNLQVTEFWGEDNGKPFSPLHVAAHYGQAEAVKYLLENAGYTKNVLDNKRYSNLIHSVVGFTKTQLESKIPPQIKIVEMLVSSNRNLIHSKNEDNLTCLNAKAVHVQHLIRLIQLGADPEAEDEDGLSFLFKAPMNMDAYDYHEIIECLENNDFLESLIITKGKKGSPFHSAIRHLNLLEKTLDFFMEKSKPLSLKKIAGEGTPVLFHAIDGRRSPEFVELLITKCKLDWGDCNFNNETGMHRAVQAGGIEMVKLLINNRCVINAKDKELLTPLHWAVSKTEPDLEIIRLLVQNQANVNSPDKANMTSLHLAVQNSQVEGKLKCEVLRLLLQSGGDPNAMDNKGQTIIHYASALPSDVLDTICEDLVTIAMPDAVRAIDNVGRTVLHHAVINRRNVSIKTLELMSTHGVNFNAKDFENGRTVLHLAMEDYIPKGFLLKLVEFGANPKIVNDDGQSPLHVAAKNGQAHAISVLAKDDNDKACVNAKDKHGATPLDYARRFGEGESWKEDVISELCMYDAEK